MNFSEQDKKGWKLLSLPFVFSLLLLAIPILTMFTLSFWTQDYLVLRKEFTLDNYKEAWFEPVYQKLFNRSLIISMTVTFLTISFAFPVAYFISFYGGRRKALWLFFITIPFWTSYLLRMFLWKVILGYKGVLNDQPRTVSLWVRSSDHALPLLGWGSSGNIWDIALDSQGPRVISGNGGGRQGSSGNVANQWHHLLLSYPGNNADLNGTRIYWDGLLIDAPGSSLDGVVNTGSGDGLRIGASYDGTVKANGTLDEIRVSNSFRGPAWAAYEYENQKSGGQFLSYDLEHLLPPVFPQDLNQTIYQNLYYSLE